MNTLTVMIGLVISFYGKFFSRVQYPDKSLGVQFMLLVEHRDLQYALREVLHRNRDAGGLVKMYHIAPDNSVIH